VDRSRRGGGQRRHLRQAREPGSNNGHAVLLEAAQGEVAKQRVLISDPPATIS
jgi:hypothetical protein